MRWYAKGLSDVGCHRANNEDQYFIDNRSEIYIVADGMGGVEGGEVASEIIVRALPQLIKSSYKECPHLENVKFQTLIQENVCTVNDSIYREGLSRNLKGMGSTFVLVIIKKRKAFIAHMGDSRCYHLRDGQLNCLTKDHVDQTNPNELTKVMGVEGLVHPDYHIVDLAKEDQLLLCSDGLNHMISDQEIEDIILKAPKTKINEDLIDGAKNAGGEDNITVVSVLPKI